MMPTTPSLIGLAMAATLLLDSFPARGSGNQQEEVLPTIEELLETAQAVNTRYPWILLNERGLTLTAYDLPREEFLRGLSAATELVFSGTEELPETISLIVHSARADRVFQEILRLDPFLTFEGRWNEKRVIFSRVADPTVGLSNEELMARYRRPRPSPNSIRSDRGMFASGTLVAEGSRIPIPLDLEVVPDRSAGKVFLLCNKIILKEFPFKNPGELDLALYQARSAADRNKAVKEKLDQIYHEVSRFPIATTAELFAGMARTAAFLPNVVGSELLGSSLHLRMGDGSEMNWILPKKVGTEFLSEPEAIQAAYDYRNKLSFDLSRGSVVFISEQFGDTVIEDGFEFFRRMDEIAVDGRWSLGEKELEIRKTWREHADAVLEYFYTSVVNTFEGDLQGELANPSLSNATNGIGIPLHIQEFLKNPLPPPVSPTLDLPSNDPPPPRVAAPEPPPPADLPAPAPLEGVGLESLIDPQAEAAEDLFPGQE